MRSDMVEKLAIISSSAPEAACTRGPAAQRYCDWALKGQHLACCLAILSHEAEPFQPVRPKAHCSRGTRMTSMRQRRPAAVRNTPKKWP